MVWGADFIPVASECQAIEAALFDGSVPQNIGREQYNAPRPVMNPVRAPIDNDLLNDLDIGTPQQPSKSGIDTSFLDDLL